LSYHASGFLGSSEAVVESLGESFFFGFQFQGHWARVFHYRDFLFKPLVTGKDVNTRKVGGKATEMPLQKAYNLKTN